MLDVNSPNEPYPTPDQLGQATRMHRQGDFEISARKLPISKSGPIDAMAKRVGIPIPEMIFGDNLVSIRHAPTGWTISFKAEDALDKVEKTDRDMLQVAYAGEWSSSREKTSAGIKEVVRPFDWSYSTVYRGSEEVGRRKAAAAAATIEAGGEGGEEGEIRLGREDEAAQIPLELLKRRDPILFFDEVVLYESELDDNGISILSVKVRVMQQRMLLLCRLFMRLDNVVVRVRDTRVYVDFGTGEVVREYTAKEDGFANVKRNLMMGGMLPDAITIALRDANQVANLLPVVDQQVDSVKLSS